MNAVMYGGGNIGRGFIGMLLSASGYDVVFIDVAQPVIENLNREHQYPVRILDDTGHRDVWVKNVSAVNGNDADQAAEAIANADIMATAVGANILKFIVPNIVEGIRRRMQRKGGPLDIIICENLMDANLVLEKMLKAQLNTDEQRWFDENIGLVEASIGRMVPVQTEQMKDGNPMRVCVESYGYLPVDKAAFKGEIPAIEGMIPFAPFDFYIKRKLYVHNMGHAVCAYLGDLQQLSYIYQAIDDPYIHIIVHNAMLESAMALAKKYSVPLENIVCHIDDLLHRFTNQALQDTCQRVGGDPARKLSAQDRLIGSMRLAAEQGFTPAYIAVGAAAGLKRYLEENQLPLTDEHAMAVLQQVSGLNKAESTFSLIMSMFGILIQTNSAEQLLCAARQTKAASRHNVV